MAATIAELRRYTLARDFRHIDPREATVMLLEGGPRILPSYPEQLSAIAKSKLRGLGRRGPREHAGEQHQAGLHRGRRLDHPDAYRRVGRRHAWFSHC